MSAVTDESVAEPQQRASGSSFYLAMRIMPKAQREAMFEIYSFCRRVDDIADDGGPSDRRLAQLQHLIDSRQADFNAACIGKTVDVLFEQSGRYDGQIVGRSAYLQPVHVNAPPDIIGQVLAVTLTGIQRYSFFGDLPQHHATRPSHASLTATTGA